MGKSPRHGQKARDITTPVLRADERPEQLRDVAAAGPLAVVPVDVPQETSRTTLHERLAMDGPGPLSDAELLCAVLGPACLDRVRDVPVPELAWAKPSELVGRGFTSSQANRLSAIFELGRRGAWDRPKRGERVLDPRRVYDLMLDVSRAELEEFWVVLIDVRGRLIERRMIAQGSLSQCPVSPRDTLRAAVKAGAHSMLFVHNHPSGDSAPSADDVDLTERLRAAADLVGVLARDHVIVTAQGYYSFVEAGRWRR